MVLKMNVFVRTSIYNFWSKVHVSAAQPCSWKCEAFWQKKNGLWGVTIFERSFPMKMKQLFRSWSPQEAAKFPPNSMWTPWKMYLTPRKTMPAIWGFRVTVPLARERTDESLALWPYKRLPIVSIFLLLYQWKLHLSFFRWKLHLFL